MVYLYHAICVLGAPKAAPNARVKQSRDKPSRHNAIPFLLRQLLLARLPLPLSNQRGFFESCLSLNAHPIGHSFNHPIDHFLTYFYRVERVHLYHPRKLFRFAPHFHLVLDIFRHGFSHYVRHHTISHENDIATSRELKRFRQCIQEIIRPFVGLRVRPSR